MNYLKSTDLGGMFLHSDDLRFKHAAYAECFRNLTLGLSEIDYRLFGAIVTDNGTGNYEITEGAVVLNGEICKVDAHSIPNVSGQTIYWIVQESDEQNGIETFQNNVSHSTYKLRKGVLSSSANPPAGYAPADMKTIRELLVQEVNSEFNLTNSLDAISQSLQSINARIGVWQDFTPNLTGTAYSTAYESNFRYRRSFEYTIFLNCHFTFAIGINGLTSFTIDLPDDGSGTSTTFKSNSILKFIAGYSSSFLIGTIGNDGSQGTQNDNKIQIVTQGLGIGVYEISFSITIELK